MMAGERLPDEIFPDLLATDAASDAAAPADLRDTLLRSVAPATRYEGFCARVARFLDLDPARTRELLRRAGEPEAEGWREEITAGLRVLHFDGGPQRAQAHCGLVRVEPGVRFPHHRHRGDEWAFVLSGCAREDGGRLWNPGDLVRNTRGSEHSFEVIGDEPFVFVVVLDDWIEVKR